jgi:hypothetical protein
MITSWVQQLGWTKAPVVENKAVPVAQAAPETVAPKAPAAPSLNSRQVQQIETDIAAVRQAVERHLADVRATVEQLAASQDQMAREIELQAAEMEILEKIPTPPPKRLAPRASPRR